MNFTTHPQIQKVVFKSKTGFKRTDIDFNKYAKKDFFCLCSNYGFTYILKLKVLISAMQCIEVQNDKAANCSYRKFRRAIAIWGVIEKSRIL